MVGIMFIGIIVGMIVGIVPTLLIFESYRRIRHKTTIQTPFPVVIFTNLIFGVSFAFYQLNTAQGESGFGASIIFPFIIGGSFLSGLILTMFYYK